jgi:hypothetical protein
MRIIIFLLFAFLLTQPVLSQPPSKAEMLEQMQKAKKDMLKQIADQEKDIASAKAHNEDLETIQEMEKQLTTMKKMLGVMDKAVSLNDNKPKALDGPSVTIPPYQSPFIRLIKQPIVVPTEAQAKDRLLWYKGKKLNDSTLITTKARVVRYSKKRNMVIVQPDEKKDSSFYKIVKNLGKSRQWTNKIISDEAARKNSFFDYPQMMMTIKEFDYIEQEFNKLADNTIKLPGAGANLMTAISQLPSTGVGGGPYMDDEMNSESELSPVDWLQQAHQELLNLLNNPPPLDFATPPKHEFDLCYYCDTSLQGKYYRDKDAWSEKFTEYEAKLISTGHAIDRQCQLMGIDISNSEIPNLEQDIERAKKFAFQRWEQKVNLLRQRYSNDVYRLEVVANCIFSLEREKQLEGSVGDDGSSPDFGFMKIFDDYIKQEIAAKNYNVIFNYAMIFGLERQKQLLGVVEEGQEMDLIQNVIDQNRFALTMDLEFQVVWKDDEDKDIMRATGYLTTPQKTYVSLGRNNCKWQLYLYDPDYTKDRTNEESFEVRLTIQEGVKMIRENEDKWVSYPYTGPSDMKTVFPSIRIDFCNNGVQDSAMMDVIRYSDADLNSISSPDEMAKKYTLDMQEYVNLMFGSVKKIEANRDAIVDVSDEIMDMQSGTAVTPTGYAPLDKMQVDYKMLQQQLKMKEKITSATRESASVILFDAVNGSPSLINKDVNMAGDKGYKIEMKKALVKLRVVQEPL